MKYLIVVVAALIMAMLILAILLTVDKKKRKGSIQIYLQTVNEMYPEHCVYDCLKQAKDVMPKGSVEYIAVDKAMYYLTNSIVHDYKTAFAMIDKAFGDPAVRELHTEIMKKEEQNIMLLLGS